MWQHWNICSKVHVCWNSPSSPKVHRRKYKGHRCGKGTVQICINTHLWRVFTTFEQYQIEFLARPWIAHAAKAVFEFCAFYGRIFSHARPTWWNREYAYGQLLRPRLTWRRCEHKKYLSEAVPFVLKNIIAFEKSSDSSKSVALLFLHGG